MTVIRISDFLRGNDPVVAGRFDVPVTVEAINPARRRFTGAEMAPTGVGITWSIGRNKDPTYKMTGLPSAPPRRHDPTRMK